jgi:hypothetical protein
MEHMRSGFHLPEQFEDSLGIEIKNARERLAEADELGARLVSGGIELTGNPDHFAMFADPPRLLSGPLKQLGYITGADNRCYPSPVDGCDYINVAASLPPSSPRRKEGWPDHIAVVHPVDERASSRMLAQDYGNPFIHHITFGIPAPGVRDEGPIEKAEQLVKRMTAVRTAVADLFSQNPGTLIIALPREVISSPYLRRTVAEWTGGLSAEQYQIEEMEGGGYLLQFFVLHGGRIEVALRHQTRQTFNPKSVHKISEDELSVDQGRSAAMPQSM